MTVDRGELEVKSATSIVLEVGSSRLKMDSNGTITLSGVKVEVVGSEIINLNKS